MTKEQELIKKLNKLEKMNRAIVKDVLNRKYTKKNELESYYWDGRVSAIQELKQKLKHPEQWKRDFKRDII